MFCQNVSRETNNKQPALRRKIIIQHLQYIEFLLRLLARLNKPNRTFYSKKTISFIGFLDKISQLKA